MNEEEKSLWELQIAKIRELEKVIRILKVHFNLIIELSYCNCHELNPKEECMHLEVCRDQAEFAIAKLEAMNQ